jgi:sugar lactone lactonase YvrE
VRTQTAELVLDARAELAEGPRWDDRTGTLAWVDILGCALHRFDPETGEDVAVEVGSHLGAAAPHGETGFVLALREGFALLEDGRVEPFAPVLAGQPDLRMNDGRCDRAGRFWAGTLSYEGRPDQAALYRLDPDGSVRTMVDGVWLSNGLDWSPDDRLLYYVDSYNFIVDVFDFDLAEGTLGGRRRFVDVDPSHRYPDGLAVDADGCVWLALCGGGKVHRYTPQGELDTVVTVPRVANVTAVAFGGPALDVLYVTTAWENLSEAELAEQPHAGGIFAAATGAAGLPTARFG